MGTITEEAANMDSTLVAAIIGVAGALLGVALTRLFDLLERRAKHQQWLDEFRLPKQIDALSTLYADAVHLQAQLGRKLLLHGATREELDAAEAARDRFDQSLALAYIYLSTDGRNAADMYRLQAHMHIVPATLNYLAPDRSIPDPDAAYDAFQQGKSHLERYHKELVRLLQQELAATDLIHPKRSIWYRWYRN
jgi:hypothetical protein